MQIQNNCSLQPLSQDYITVLASIWNSACSLQLDSPRSEKNVQNDECRSKTAVACSHCHCVLPQSQLQFEVWLQLVAGLMAVRKSIANDECRSKTSVASTHCQCVIPQSQLLFGILHLACRWTHGGLTKALKMMNVGSKQLQLVAMASVFYHSLSFNLEFCLQLVAGLMAVRKSVENDECRSKKLVACSHGQCVIPKSQLLFRILPVACSWTHGGQKKALKMMNVDPKQLQLVAIARILYHIVSFYLEFCLYPVACSWSNSVHIKTLKIMNSYR